MPRVVRKNLIIPENVFDDLRLIAELREYASVQDFIVDAVRKVVNFYTFNNPKEITRILLSDEAEFDEAGIREFMDGVGLEHPTANLHLSENTTNVQMTFPSMLIENAGSIAAKQYRSTSDFIRLCVYIRIRSYVLSLYLSNRCPEGFLEKLSSITIDSRS